VRRTERTLFRLRGLCGRGSTGLYRGVAILYAGEIAVNHCAPDAQRSELLDAHSTSQEPLSRYAHIHCWHVDEKFLKHAFMRGRYTPEDAQDLDLHVVRDYCMAMSFRSLGDLEAPQRVEDTPRREVVEQAQHQPEERAPFAASVALQRPSARNSSDAGVSSWSARAGLGPEASLPLVSCICPTYNRPPHHQHLLEEAISSVIGDKQDGAVGLACGEPISPWDDDISLPWRLSLLVERLGDGDYFNPRCYWFLDNDGLHFDHPVGYANNASLFRRATFEGVGGYPSESL
jgi:hypothetical protein